MKNSTQSLKLFKSFVMILFIGSISSLFPFLLTGLVLGFPSVVLGSILVSLVFRKQLSK